MTLPNKSVGRRTEDLSLKMIHRAFVGFFPLLSATQLAQASQPLPTIYQRMVLSYAFRFGDSHLQWGVGFSSHQQFLNYVAFRKEIDLSQMSTENISAHFRTSDGYHMGRGLRAGLNQALRMMDPTTEPIEVWFPFVEDRVNLSAFSLRGSGFVVAYPTLAEAEIRRHRITVADQLDHAKGIPNFDRQIRVAHAIIRTGRRVIKVAEALDPAALERLRMRGHSVNEMLVPFNRRFQFSGAVRSYADLHMLPPWVHVNVELKPQKFTRWDLRKIRWKLFWGDLFQRR